MIAEIDSISSHATVNMTILPVLIGSSVDEFKHELCIIFHAILDSQSLQFYIIDSYEEALFFIR